MIWMLRRSLIGADLEKACKDGAEILDSLDNGIALYLAVTRARETGCSTQPGIRRPQPNRPPTSLARRWQVLGGILDQHTLGLSARKRLRDPIVWLRIRFWHVTRTTDVEDLGKKVCHTQSLENTLGIGSWPVGEDMPVHRQ